MGKEVDFNRRKMQKEDSAAPATQQPTTYDHFLRSHRSQLEGVGLPESLWKRLFIKLKAQIFDAADTFEFEYDPNTTTGVEYRVVTKKALQPLSDVFLIDHAWTTTADKAREQLRTIPHLLQRM